MPKKKAPKARGQTITLSAFTGDTGTQSDLPTGPANHGEDTGYFGRPRGGFDDRPAGASDGKDDWRRAGSKVPSFGQRNRNSDFGGPPTQADTGPWRRGGDAPAPRAAGNRFGGLSGDARWGGDSVDTRPAHLRRFGASASGGQDARRTGTQDPRYVSSGSNNSTISYSSQKAAPKPKKVVVEQKRRVPRDDVELAEELRNVKLTDDEGLNSALENAVAKGGTVDEKGLVSSFARLSLETLRAPAAGVVLAQSLLDKKLTTVAFVAAFEAACENKLSDDATAVLYASCRAINQKGKKARALLMEADEEAAKALTAALRGEQTTEAFDALLKSQNLEFLNPVPDLSGKVSELLAGGADAAAVLKLLEAELPSGRMAPKLKPLIVVSILERVFENKSAMELSIVDAWTAVLERVAESDADNEADALFAAQQVWFRGGANRDNVLPMFKKLLEAKVVSYEGLCAWRDDRVRGKNQKKSMCLLAANNWITEIAPTACYCNEADDDQMVECQTRTACGGWVHWDCEGLEGDALDEAMDSAYVCSRCSPQEEA